MKTHPLDLALAVAFATLQALRPLLVALVALLLTLAGYRPSQRPASAAKAHGSRRGASVPTQRPPAPSERLQAAPAALEVLTVRQLRQLAREAGLRALARTGRRVDLLQALAA